MEVAVFKKEVWDHTRRIAESMNCIFSPVSENYGLTMMQTRILMELHQNGPHTIGSLACSICAAGTNISSMCKKLESLGLLERARKREDERVVRVMLTKEGEETAAQIDRLCNEKILQRLVNEDEKTFEDIIQGLRKLNELLQSISCIEKR